MTTIYVRLKDGRFIPVTGRSNLSRSEAESWVLRNVDDAELDKMVHKSAVPYQLAAAEGVPVSGSLYNGNIVIENDDGTADVRAGGTRAWRSNNPGNIEYGPNVRRFGAIGTDGRFAIFPNDSVGYNATIALLNEPSYRDLSIGAAIGRWAPPNENQTETYADFVARQLGVPVTTLLSELTSGQIDQMAAAIRRFEGWREGEVTHFPQSP